MELKYGIANSKRTRFQAAAGSLNEEHGSFCLPFRLNLQNPIFIFSRIFLRIKKKRSFKISNNFEKPFSYSSQTDRICRLFNKFSPPVLVIKIPSDCLDNTCFKTVLRFISEFSHNLLCIDCITAIVTETIGYMGNQSFC